MCRRGMIVLVLLVLAGCASQSSHAQAGTVTKQFRPYTATGDLSVKVADVTTGTCWTTSIAVPVVRAYRCLAGNSILDPCFVPAHPSTPVEVACVQDPWSPAEVVQVTAPLPKAEPDAEARARPWAIELANGARCVAATGTVPSVQGVDLGYHCRNGGNAGLRKSAGPTATADYARTEAAGLRPVLVTTIWRV